jgi:hypothetical protein
MAIDRRRIADEFSAVVNMTAAELRKWLRTVDSLRVGWKGGDGSVAESVGHRSGRLITAILDKNAEALTDSDYAHMRKVVGFVRRHLAQEPANIVTSRWRYSLMNWGHDPLKDRSSSGTESP